MKDLKEYKNKDLGKYKELSSGFYEVKKSKFYSYIFAVDSENNINEILTNIRKDNKKARHIVYAYRFIDAGGNITVKFSNDNEPQGTGVNSIISMLEKEDVTNYLVVIVRYFGGTLLGAGPLLRSYLNSFKDAYKKIYKSL